MIKWFYYIFSPIKKIAIILLVFSLGLLPYDAVAQSFHLDVIPVDSGTTQTFSFKNRTDVWHFLRQKRTTLQRKGFLACSVDSLSDKDSTITAWFYTGSKFQWAQLDFSDLPAAIWNRLNIHQQDWQQVPISPNKLAGLHQRILTYCDNNGYPFAYTYLDSFQTTKKGLYAKFHLVHGPLENIDTIIVHGTADISLSYLENYLNIHQHQPYNEAALRKIKKRLNDLAFLQESKPWRMDFTIGKNKLNLYLEPKKANQINGLIGLQPNTEATGKFLLTADFLLGLQNSLGYGETINATYKNLQYKSPQFHVNVLAPYILGTMFGLEGSFDLYKKDTTYRKLEFTAGIRYQFSAEDYVRLFYQNTGNRLITADTHYVRINKKLPDNIDVKSQGFGVDFVVNRTDYIRNPQRGWLASITALGSVRKVLPNDAIEEMGQRTGFDVDGLYEKANADKYQVKLSGSVGWYFPIYRSIIGYIHYQGGYISGENLFRNELFQIGGFSTLRGFDENSFYASQYHIAHFEVHFGFGRDDYFYVFNDDAMVFTQFQNSDTKDYPISFGLGISLENKSGVFHVAVGVGKHYKGHFQFRNAKIHFGYAAYF